MQIYPEFKIGEEIFIKIDSRLGIIIYYQFDENVNLYYGVRYIVNDNYVIKTFHKTELSREHNG